MSSFTPGILQNLLQNVGDKDFKVAGEHRSALLQVISIVPSLEDDPWKTRGYHLRVSDSLHSAYVSVCNEDVELILSDKILLGQFIPITRVDPSSPVPVLCGVKPIPKRRPCVGDPKDLISSAFVSAVRSLEEASLFESVIQCISMYAELCDLFKRDTREPLVEKFLDLHEHMMTADSVIRTVMNNRTSETREAYDSQFCLIPGKKNTSLWVDAAVETGLPKFTSYTKGDEKAITNGEKHHWIVLEKSREKPKTWFFEYLEVSLNKAVETVLR